jgi:hypothetical protein
MNTTTHRPLFEIARDIRKSWGANVWFGAKPYLEAMGSLDRISDSFYADSGVNVVSGFLANAATWRGDDAKRIKAELKNILKQG